MNVFDSSENKFGSTRRGFLKGLIGTGAAAALYGCSGGDGDTFYVSTPVPDTPGEEAATYIYGSNAHNCSGTCIIRGRVVNGKITRFLTDESVIGYGSGNAAKGIDMNSPNRTQSRACAKCRSYRLRLYNPGRLRYPMKQTKTRGDLTGFVRVSWDDALAEIAKKVKITQDTHGPDAMYDLYASGGGGVGSLLPYSGGRMGYWGSYSTHQFRYVINGYSGFPQYVNHTANSFSTRYTGNSYMATHLDITDDTKNYVMYGSNYLSTSHPQSYGTMRGIEEMKKRGGKVIFVGPECVDQAVTLATEWIPSKPYTDPALFLAMIFEGIVNTFDTDGTVKADPWMDVDYLDTMVYGFFDSPEYWINQRDGTISLTEPASADLQQWVPIQGPQSTVNLRWNQEVTSAAFPALSAGPDDTLDFMQVCRRIYAVPAGRSLASYVMGDDLRLENATYGMPTNSAGKTNYYAKAFEAAANNKRASRCSYPVKGVPAHSAAANSSRYKTKNDFYVKKNAAWASAITGIPAARITELARFYFDRNNHPIYNDWCGGLQKQADGLANLLIMQMFFCIAKVWGIKGAGWGRGLTQDFSKASNANAGNIGASASASNPSGPVASCTAWHNGIKMTYATELAANGYASKWVPDNQGTDLSKAYMDDGGAKAMLKWKRTGSSVNTLPSEDGKGEYYVWDGFSGSTIPTAGSTGYKRAGFRVVANSAGNIPVNQHECSNDLADLWSKLPKCDVNNADSFCLYVFDNYLTPSARCADYVLPAATNWEQPMTYSTNYGNAIYVPVVSAPPGEARSGYDYTASLLSAYDRQFGTSHNASFTGGKTQEQKGREAVEALCKNSSSVFYGMSYEQYLENAYIPGLPGSGKNLIDCPLRTDLDAYLADKTNIETTPFLAQTGTEAAHVPYIVTFRSDDGLTGAYQGGYGNDYPTYALPSKTLGTLPGGGDWVTRAPNASGKFQVFSAQYVWTYEWKFSKWHGYLPMAERGQKNSDYEGDPHVYPIPIYFAYEDYFMEAYSKPSAGELKTTDEIFGAGQGLLLTTTHDRYRSHSTFGENGYTRELTHRTVKGSSGNNAGRHIIKPGGLYSGDDWGEYALSAPLGGDMSVNGGGDIPRINKAVQYRQGNATYSECWINPEDAIARNIEDGDLMKLENPVGAVRVVARVSSRAAKGYVALHQGCWYDPDPVDGVDDGGNANTLMSQRHSRVDHGNGQQSAMVKVTKVG